MTMAFDLALAIMRKDAIDDRQRALVSQAASSEPDQALTAGGLSEGRQTRVALDAMGRTHNKVLRQIMLRRLS